MKNILKFLLPILFLLNASNFYSHDLKGAIASDDRTPKNTLRDTYRNPYETLSFFGIESDMTIIELSPGGGWYTEILANYIHYPGTLIAAHFSADSDIGYYRRSRANFEQKISNNPMYGRVEIVDLDSSLGDLDSVDAVLTFRNLHNWLGPKMDDIFSNTFAVLKPGGVFGVVEHRAKPGTSMEVMKKSGYVTEKHAIEIAKKHGSLSLIIEGTKHRSRLSKRTSSVRPRGPRSRKRANFDNPDLKQANSKCCACHKMMSSAH